MTHQRRYVQKWTAYEAMGIAAMLPGMQHMITLMQRALDDMRAALARVQTREANYEEEAGDATAIQPYDDPRININMSVWESIEALQALVYRSQHVGPLRDRKKWFEKMSLPHYCLWWIPAGHIPTVAEARERLEYYQANGATPYAFWFHECFPAPAAEPAIA